MANETPLITPAPGGAGHPNAAAPGAPINVPTGNAGRPNAAAPEETNRDAGRMVPSRPRSQTRATASPAVQAPMDPMVLAAAMTAVNKAVTAHVSNQLPTPDMDKTIPGGRYKVEGAWVDAHGREVKPPEEDEDDDTTEEKGA